MKKNKKTKKTKKKSSGSNNRYLYVIASLLFVLVILSAFLAKIVYENKEVKKRLTNTTTDIKELEKKVSRLQNEVEKLKKSNTTLSEIKDYEQALKTIKIPKVPPIQKPQPKPAVIIAKKRSHKKPKLVIIIDDVSFYPQVKEIKSIPFAITPSFFPPNKMHPHTAFYAKEFKDYMVHVPMEAINWNKPEIHTLKTTTPYEEILNDIVSIKKEFPKVKFINNHTGSKFTSDLKAMQKLFRALKKENLGFVDSKTTPDSKSKEADKTYHIPLFSRDIFLDNKENVSYIHSQLKKAVNIARKKG